MAETKLKSQQAFQGDGWDSANETWTYATAQTFTIAGVDRTTTFSKGTRIKLTQTSAKYFIVSSSSFSTNTTVTLRAGSDYSLTNAAITSPFYSYKLNPVGFPAKFNLTAPTWTTSGTAFTNQPQSNSWRFYVNGSICHLYGIMATHATSGGTGIFIATFTTSEFPPCIDAHGTAFNISSANAAGISWVSDGQVFFKMMKYDGTALAGNGSYVEAQIYFELK